ncbi:Ig-like domain-containing protein [Legionella lytica]|uniref:Ig-like domain-containing protein n=1 Tax=Legionella lytica TaxID=96232 RepID=A0ABW8DD97_9GAMM
MLVYDIVIYLLVGIGCIDRMLVDKLMKEQGKGLIAHWFSKATLANKNYWRRFIAILLIYSHSNHLFAAAIIPNTAHQSAATSITQQDRTGPANTPVSVGSWTPLLNYAQTGNLNNLSLTSQQLGLLGPIRWGVKYSDLTGTYVNAQYILPLSEHLALGALGEYGANQYRINGTLGYGFSPISQIKFTAERLSQRLPFQFDSGPIDSRVHQDAYGIRLQRVFNGSVLQGLNWGGYSADARSKDLKPLVFMSNGTNCGGFLSDLHCINYRHLAGGLSKGLDAGIDFLLSPLTLISTSLYYDQVHYRTVFSSASSENRHGMGGGIRLNQLLGDHLKLNAEFSVRKIYDTYQARLSWLPSFQKMRGGMELTFFGQHVASHNATPDNNSVGLQVSFLADGRTRYDERYQWGSQRLSELTQSIMTPAVKLNQVLVVSEQVTRFLAATIVGITPNNGPLSGGNTVTILGSNFVPGVLVFFDSQLANNVQVHSSSRISAVVPAGHTANEAVYVAVSNPDSQSSLFPKGYTYLAPSANTITVVSGSGQSTAIGSVFSKELIAKVSDSYGNPVSGVTVTFAATGSEASASLSPPMVITDSDGRASITATANAKPGSYTVLATVEGVRGSVVFNLTNNPGAGASIEILGDSSMETSVGTDFSQLTVLVKDSDDNVVPNRSVKFTVMSDASGASATFTTSNPASTLANGQASVIAKANTIPGTYTVTAALTDEPSISTSYTLTNNPGAVASIEILGDSSLETSVGTDFSQLTVLVKDSDNNVVPNTSVKFTAMSDVSGASATFTTANPASTLTNGQASVTAKANTISGTYTVTAALTDEPSISTSYTLTNNPGAAASIEILGNSSLETSVGTDFSQITVLVKDSDHNVVPNTSVKFTSTSDASAASATFITANPTNTLTNGEASVTAQANTKSGTYTVTATLTDEPSISTSYTLTNNPGTAAVISMVSGSEQSAAVDTAFSAALVAKVTDSHGNAVPAVLVQFTSKGSTAGAMFTTPNPLSTTTNGQASVMAKANTVLGSYTVVAKATGVTTPASFTLTNDAITGVTANGTTFASDAGFPTTGFSGAQFTINLASGAPEKYTWTSSASSWANVSNGVVKFNSGSKPTNGSVTITATPETSVAGGASIIYQFNLTRWFVNNGDTIQTQTEATNYCTGKGYDLSAASLLTSVINYDEGLYGDQSIGNLYGEWGGPSSRAGMGSGVYVGSGWQSLYYWSSTIDTSSGKPVNVDLNDGNAGAQTATFFRRVVCVASI